MSSLIVEVCKISAIEKHPNADRLDLATVKGWQCITEHGKYAVGDLVVFIPPDCVLPPQMIEKYDLGYLKGNGRTGTVKLRGMISQGLILPPPNSKCKAGDNVADMMGITKWMPPEAPVMRGVQQVSKRKMNPAFSKYTEIENIKNFNSVFCTDDVVVVTEKIHGTNARYGMLPITIADGTPFFYRLRCWFEKIIFGKTHEFTYGSHNVQLGTNKLRRNNFYQEDVWAKIARQYKLDIIIPEDYIVYGEIFGEGIQDLTYGIKGLSFRVFDISYKGNYLSYTEFIDTCLSYQLPIVPILYVGKWYDGLLEEYTSGKSIICPEQMREGIVIKSFDERFNPQIGRKILKSISTEYLTRKGGTEYT